MSRTAGNLGHPWLNTPDDKAVLYNGAHFAGFWLEKIILFD
jgi:hypothetical protein